jgi:hypothetical protein
MRCEDTCASCYQGNLYSNWIEVKSADLDKRGDGLSETISAITSNNREKTFPLNEMQVIGNPKIPTQFRKNGQNGFVLMQVWPRNKRCA